MKILQMNGTVFGSTGNIMINISKNSNNYGQENIISYPKSRTNLKKEFNNSIIIGTISERNIHGNLSKLTGLNGCFSFCSTKRFLNKIKKINPDIIHLHNIHDNYINVPVLFNYIKKNNIKLIWTLHDCWSFTGHCPYFDLVKCDKWKNQCCKCPQYREYPKSFTDNSKFMYKLKKKWFTNVKDMTIVTPSKWLADLVKQSFLKEYPVKVINNGIDLSVFKPLESNFREKYSIPKEKFILLGVAFGWGKRKGLDVFIELSERLDNSIYQIVLVGTNDEIDKALPENIISIHRTNNQTELAEIYSAADLFVNPTREENYPTVNMESIACGTPVLTFNTGGSPEILDEFTGSVVCCDDIDAMKKEIERINKERPFTTEACLKRAKSFDMNDRFRDYIELYKV